MKSRIAAAVALGYFLGRTKKMKLAIVVGGLLAGKKLPTDPAELLRQGVKSVAGSDELSSLTGDLRGQLVKAAKTAATAAVSRKIESLGDSLTERASGLRDEAGEASPARDAGTPEADSPETPGAEQASEADRPKARARQNRGMPPERAGRGGSPASDRPRRGKGDA